MFEITIQGEFRAFHRLRLPDGTWEPRHEHAWHVRATAAGAQLDVHGLLLDFHPLEDALREILGDLGPDLNVSAALAGVNPTAEHVALHIGCRLAPRVPAPARLRNVEVEEAPGCWARYILPEPH